MAFFQLHIKGLILQHILDKFVLDQRINAELLTMPMMLKLGSGCWELQSYIYSGEGIVRLEAYRHNDQQCRGYKEWFHRRFFRGRYKHNCSDQFARVSVPLARYSTSAQAAEPGPPYFYRLHRQPGVSGKIQVLPANC